jgi:hypothetical protein
LGGSTCSGGVCTCPFGTVVRLGECQPIQQVTPGSPCDNQLLRCTGLSVCVSNRCECPSGMTIQAGTCRVAPTVIAGSSCASGERCGGLHVRDKAWNYRHYYRQFSVPELCVHVSHRNDQSEWTVSVAHQWCVAHTEIYLQNIRFSPAAVFLRKPRGL